MKQFIAFDGMCWPLPDNALIDIVTYGKPTREDLARAAARMEAYGALIGKTQKDREIIVRKLQTAIKEGKE